MSTALSIVFHLVMIFITGGLWIPIMLIWFFVRAMGSMKK